MRTTITVDDDLLDDLKRRAAEQGSTVSQLIEASVRFAFGGKGTVDRQPSVIGLVW